MKIGSIEISDLKIGANTASRMYIGSSQIWPTEEHPDVDINYVQFSSGQYIDLGWNIVDSHNWNNIHHNFCVDANVMLTEDNLKTNIWFANETNKSVGDIFEQNQIRTCGINSWPSNFYQDISTNVEIEYKLLIRNPLKTAGTPESGERYYNNTIITTTGFHSGSELSYPSTNVYLGGLSNANGGLRIYHIDFLEANHLLSYGEFTYPMDLYNYKPVLHWVDNAYVPCLKEILHGQYCYPNTGTLIYG